MEQVDITEREAAMHPPAITEQVGIIASCTARLVTSTCMQSSVTMAIGP